MSLSTIRHRSDFLKAFTSGKKFIAGTFILQMLERKDHPVAGPEARFGFTVTKKMGNAVVRNRIKRRLREAAAKAAVALALPGCDYVIVSRHKALDCPFSDLLRDMEFAFSRIPSMKNETGTLRPKKPVKKTAKPHA